MECRFYEKEFPLVDDFVMVQVKKVTETSAYVTLCEYNGIEGMILLSEVSTRRIRSMLKEIRQGQFCICLVLRVEEDKGYIDLSRRRVNAQERQAYLATYSNSKTVHSILRQLAAVHKTPMLELCEKIAWPLYKKYKHANDAFKTYVADKDDKIFREMGIDGPLLESLLSTIERRLTPTEVKLKAAIDVQCFESAGIDAIKEALLAGQALNTPEQDNVKVQLRVVAPPHYDVVTQSMGMERGMAKMEAVLKKVEETILAAGGKFVIESKPELVETDMLNEQEKEKSDDSGSDSEGSDVEGMGDFDIGDDAKAA